MLFGVLLTRFILLNLIANTLNLNAKTFFFNCNYRDEAIVRIQDEIDKIGNDLNQNCAISNNLKRLDLKQNRIKFLMNNELRNLPRLKSIQLSRNKLENIGERIFSHNKDLEFIDLSSNKLKFFPKSVFQGLSNLRSLNVDNNKIRRIHESIFKDLRKLEFLYLAFNKFKSLPEKIFANLKNVQLIYLHPFYFLRTNLKLRIYDERIEFSRENCQFKIGYNKFWSEVLKAYKSANKARICSLQNFISYYRNATTGLKIDSFVNQSSVDLIGIERIQNTLNVYSSRWNRLERIEIWNSVIKTLDQNLFQYLYCLKQIYLIGNRQLKRIPNKIFSNLFQLEEIRILGNPLTKLPPNLFDCLTKLHTLLLNENELKELPKLIFKDLIRLEKLELSNNELTYLDSHILQNSIQLKHLNLMGNPINKKTFYLVISKFKFKIEQRNCKNGNTYFVIDDATSYPNCYYSIVGEKLQRTNHSKNQMFNSTAIFRATNSKNHSNYDDESKLYKSFKTTNKSSKFGLHIHVLSISAIYYLMI